MNLRLLVCFVLSQGLALIGSSRFSRAAPASPQDFSSSITNDSQIQHSDSAFNLLALANTIQDSSSATSNNSGYHLIDGSGSLTDPKLIYQQSGHSNHRDYPGEPYPSASYTSSVVVSASNQSVPHNHQAGGQQPTTTSYTRTGSADDQQFINSYGNQSPSSAPKFETGNNNNNNHQMLMNAGLIQNLTAALFPVEHIPNVTLFQTLTDLLNKTHTANNNNNYYFTTNNKQQANNKPKPIRHQQQQQPTYNHAYTNFYTPAGQSMVSSSSLVNSFDSANDILQQSNQLNSLLGLIQPNNFSPPPKNKFGFRAEPAKHQPASSSTASQFRSSPFTDHSFSQYTYQRPIASPATTTKANSPKTSYSSTYAQPFRSASSNILPLLTNGQSLNQLAASLLSSPSSYSGVDPLAPQAIDLLPDGLKLPSNYQQQSNHKPTFASGHYNYLQHQNSGAQNHLDRVVYHSTPFRPSIVSPPPSMASPSPGTNGSYHHNQSHHQTQTRNTTSSSIDSNSSKMAFGTLSSSSISDSSSSPPHTNHQMSPSAAGSSTSEKQANYPVTFNDDNSATTHHQQQPTNGANHSTASASTLMDKPQSSSISGGQSSSTLLDIYEREIDQQIRDALLGESGNILSSMASRLVQPAMAAATTTGVGVGGGGWSYDEPSVDQSLLASWIRANPQSVLNHATSQSQQIEQFSRPTTTGTSYESLTEALHELPTFSAADLQPLFPSSLFSPSTPTTTASGASYSPMTSASQESPLEQPTSGWPYSSLLNQQQDEAQLSLQTLQQFLGTGQQAAAATTKRPKAQQHLAMESASTSANPGFPSLFYKFPNPLAPLFSANPFNHLYSSLPKNRNNSKTKPASAGSQKKLLASGSKSTNFLGAPSESRNKQLYTFGSYPSASSTTRYQQQQMQLQQQQQQQLASLLANLMAATGSGATTPNPLLNSASEPASSSTNINQQQAALFSADNSFASDPTLTDAQFNQLNAQMDQFQMQPGQSLGSYSGLAGGGISPLLWRSLLPQASVTSSQRPLKLSSPPSAQMTSSQSAIPLNYSPTFAAAATTSANSNNFSPIIQNHQQGSQQTRPLQQQQQQSVTSTSSSPSLLRSPTGTTNSRPPLNALAGSLPAASTQQQQPSSKQQQQPKLKIRILKIPIAVYDQPNQSAAGGQPAAFSLLGPPNSQSAAASNLLASLLCPMHHHGNQLQQQVAPHSLEKHLMTSASGTSNLSSPLLSADTLSSLLESSSPQLQQASMANLLAESFSSPQMMQTLTTSGSSVDNSSLQDKLLMQLAQS